MPFLILKNLNLVFCAALLVFSIACVRKDHRAPSLQFADLQQDLHQQKVHKAQKRALSLNQYWPRAPETPWALKSVGDALAASGLAEKVDALKFYDLFLTHYPHHEDIMAVLNKQRSILNVMLPPLEGDVSDWPRISKKILNYTERSIQFAPFAEDTPQLLLRCARAYQVSHQIAKALQYYQQSINQSLPDSSIREIAIMEMARYKLSGYRDVRRGQTFLVQARALLKRVVREFPKGRYREEADRLLNLISDEEAKKLLADARYYLTLNNKQAARLTLEGLLKNYRSTAYAQEALQLLDQIRNSENRS